jgi:hypothetical protein
MVHMRDLADQETAWSIIRSLIADGRLVMCREAWNELKNVDKAIYKALQDVKDTLVLPLTGADMLPKVGVIQHKYRQLCRPRIRRHIADGYIIAYAKERGYVVVTDEQEKRQKMPVVCRKEGIPCIDLPTLLELEADLAA